MHRYGRRILIPLLLIALGLWLLSGCIYIPTFDSVKQGRNAAKEVGDAKSDRPVRIGHATRDDVIRVLGEPQFINPDRSKFAYSWRVTRGVWIMPLCFDAHSVRGERALVLQFDSAGNLSSYRLQRSDEEAFALFGSATSTPIDPDMRANPNYAGWAKYFDNSTRPTNETQP